MRLQTHLTLLLLIGTALSGAQNPGPLPPRALDSKEGRIPCGFHVGVQTNEEQSDILREYGVRTAPAQDGNFPFMVRVFVTSSYHNSSLEMVKNFVFECTGIIWSRSLVLTSATCLLPGAFVREFGFTSSIYVTSLGRAERDRGFSERVRDWTVHEDFYIQRVGELAIKSIKNDLAVLQLDRPLRLLLHPSGGAVNRVCLNNETTRELGGSKLYLLDWSQVQANEVGLLSRADGLRFGKATAASDERCRQAGANLNEGQFCAITSSEDAYPCAYGAVLIRYWSDENPLWELEGIHSFSKTLCGPAVYVFTRVSFYYKWLMRLLNRIDGRY